MRMEVTKQMQELGIKTIRKVQTRFLDCPGELVTYSFTSSDKGLRVSVRKLNTEDFTTISIIRGDARTTNFQKFSDVIVKDSEGPSALEESINDMIKKAASIYKVKRRLK